MESCWNTILKLVTLLLNILLSWAFETSLNCSVMCRPPWWFECYFLLSSSIHCWLLLAVLSDYFGHLVSSTFLLCKFCCLPWSTPVSFPLWDVERFLEWRDRLPGNGNSHCAVIVRLFRSVFPLPNRRFYSCIRIKDRHCLKNKIYLSMKIKLLWEAMQDFSPCSLFALPSPCSIINSIKHY